MTDQPNAEGIKQVILNRLNWLKGNGGKRAYLRWADLRGADLRGAYLSGADLRWAIGLRRDGMPDADALRSQVAKKIREHPELHDQSTYGGGDPGDCGTPCCVAGWACRLGGGTYGLSVPTAATILLWQDGKKMPSFGTHATREQVLEALES